MLALTRSLIVVTVLSAAAAMFSGIARAQEGCLDQIAPEQRARLEQQRISLNLRDASIATTLRLLAQQYKLNMVVTDDVTGAITLDFFQVPARDVFQAILDAARLDCAAAGGALRVSTSRRLRAEQGERDKAEADQRKQASEESRQAADLQRALCCPTCGAVGCNRRSSRFWKESMAIGSSRPGSTGPHPKRSPWMARFSSTTTNRATGCESASRISARSPRYGT